jgi:hypothetical protein
MTLKLKNGFSPFVTMIHSACQSISLSQVAEDWRPSYSLGI